MIPLIENLQQLKPICLEEIETLKLLNRIDRKYLLNRSEYIQFSEEVALLGYRVLTVNNCIVQDYQPPTTTTKSCNYTSTTTTSGKTG